MTAVFLTLAAFALHYLTGLEERDHWRDLLGEEPQ